MDHTFDCALDLGSIKGEISTKDENFANLVGVLSWSWGAVQAGAAGATTGKVNVQELTVTKYLDRASPNLFQACCLGQVGKIAKATLKARTSGKMFLEIEMEEVLVSSYSVGGGGETMPTETVGLSFTKVKVKYTPRETRGSGAVEAGWDINGNKKV